MTLSEMWISSWLNAWGATWAIIAQYFLYLLWLNVVVLWMAWQHVLAR